MPGAEQAIILTNCDLFYWHMYRSLDLSWKYVIQKNVLLRWLFVTWTAALC